MMMAKHTSRLLLLMLLFGSMQPSSSADAQSVKKSGTLNAVTCCTVTARLSFVPAVAKVPGLQCSREASSPRHCCTDTDTTLVGQSHVSVSASHIRCTCRHTNHLFPHQLCAIFSFVMLSKTVMLERSIFSSNTCANNACMYCCKLYAPAAQQSLLPFFHIKSPCWVVQYWLFG